MDTVINNFRPAIVLLAEDNVNDIELTTEGFKRAKLAVELHTVNNGEQCMAFLRKEEPYENAPTPDVLLLDLNMPRMTGYEVLSELVEDEVLGSIPVVILTTSADEQEVLKMYQLRCSSYIVKPVDFNKFVKVIQLLSDYWFTVVVLPSDASQHAKSAESHQEM